MATNVAALRWVCGDVVGNERIRKRYKGRGTGGVVPRVAPNRKGPDGGQ